MLGMAAALAGGSAGAQSQPAPPSPAQERSVATVAIQGVTVSGSLSVADGQAVIGNNGAVTAGDKTAKVTLTRGGTLDVCESTKVHLATDESTPGGALMIALDRGALEAHYTPGQYSDVILTPDLRILISGPGKADLSLRVNNQGDTCVDNHGNQAPYVLASNLFEGGAYRIQANQRVLFEHGSLNEVVDNEPDPCGCPPAEPESVASTGRHGGPTALPGEKVANEVAKENPFPLAESEGLKAPPAEPNTPPVPAGQVHAEVQAPLVYNSANPELPPPPKGETEAVSAPATTAQAAPAAKPHRGFFGHIGHFFKRMFGGK